MDSQLNMKKYKRLAIPAVAFLLLTLALTSAFADYSINGYTVKGTGGDNIQIVDTSGNIVYNGEGVRNQYGRLALPDSSSLSSVIQAPNVTQGYAQSPDSSFGNYKGEVAIQKNGQVVGWGSLYDNNDNRGHVYINQEGIHSSELANGQDSWIRSTASGQGYNVNWNQYAGGLGMVDLNRQPPNTTLISPVQIEQPCYFTETTDFAGPAVEDSRSRTSAGQTRKKTSSYLYTVDGKPTVETSQYVQGDYLYTVKTKKWARFQYEKQTWTTNQVYQTQIHSKTPWYHRYTQYKEIGGITSVVSSWSDSTPYRWTYSSGTTQELVPLTTTTQDVLVNSWQMQDQTVTKVKVQVAVNAQLSPNEARRGDVVTITAQTNGPVKSVFAVFPSGTVQLTCIGNNQWMGTYLVDNDDGSYPVTINAVGSANEAATTVSLTVSGDRYHVVPNITGGN